MEELGIYHFLKSTPFEDGLIYERVLGTFFRTEKEADAYFESLRTGRPYKNIFALNMGDWRPRLLIERLAKKNKDFRVSVFSTDDMGTMGNVDHHVARHTMSWATAENVFFMNILESDVIYGPEDLGLEIEFAKKIGKRNQEICRFSMMSYYSDEGDEFLWLNHEDLGRFEGTGINEDYMVLVKYTTPSDRDVKLHDGMNFVTKRFALAALYQQPKSTSRDRMIRKIHQNKHVRFSFRLIGPFGLVKGDCIVVPNGQLGLADVVYCDENLKSEFRTTGWVLATFTEHKPVHMATYNSQSMINNPKPLSWAKFRKDLNAMREDAYASIHGELPKWMLMVQESHETGATGVIPENMSIDVSRGYNRWQMYNYRDREKIIGLFGIEASQNFMRMGLGGITSRMLAGLSDDGNFKKMFLPITNAYNYAVVTRSALVDMGGFDLPNVDYVQFIDGVGAVIPDERFIRTFDLHGTWDQDDNADFIFAKFWTSKPEHVKNLKADGVIGNTRTIPSDPERAILGATVIRSPNGPGEYSIEFIEQSDDLDIDYENLEVIDLASLPRGQNYMLANVRKTGMARFTTGWLQREWALHRPMTADDAIYMIEAQVMNQGIGQVANALMLWVDTMGPSFPPVMTDVFGELVDAVQQSFDKMQIAKVNAEGKLILNQLAAQVEASKRRKIDTVLYIERCKVVGDFTEIFEANLDDHVPTKASRVYGALYAELEHEVAESLFTIRAGSELVRHVRRINVGSDLDTWCEKFYNKWNNKFRGIAKKYRARPKDPTLKKISMTFQRSDALGDTVDQMVTELREFGDDMDRRVVALYKWILAPRIIGGHDFPLGTYDQVIFQNATTIDDDQPGEAVFDLLAQAILRRQERLGR